MTVGNVQLLSLPDASVALPALLRGVALGLAAAVPIGPVNVEIARRALRFGFAAGVALGLGAVTVDVVYALLSTLSFVKLLNQPAVLLPIAAAGALLLGYLGVQCLRAARSAWKVDPLAEADATADTEATPDLARPAVLRRAYLTGLLMTLLNPMTLVFWFVAVPAMGATPAPAASSQAAGADLPMMCVGVFVGTLAWVLTFSTLLAIAGHAAGSRPGRRRRWLAIADAVGGVALIGFALLSAVGFWRRLDGVL